MVRAERLAVCPGDDFNTLYDDRIRAYGLTRCKLQMLRLADPGFRLPAAMMSDLGLQDAIAAMPIWPPRRHSRRGLPPNRREHLRHGVHLIVVQSEDGSLQVGDSHHYAATPDPLSQGRRSMR